MIKQVSSIRGTVRNVSGRGNNLGEIRRDWEIIGIDTRSVSITRVYQPFLLVNVEVSKYYDVCRRVEKKSHANAVWDCSEHGTRGKGRRVIQKEEICCWMQDSKVETHNSWEPLSREENFHELMVESPEYRYQDHEKESDEVGEKCNQVSWKKWRKCHQLTLRQS